MTGTALITGASSGLGREFATLFARDKHDLVLVARRESVLREIAADLTGAFGVRVTVIGGDLSEADTPASIARQLEEQSIAIDALVNNAGVGVFGEFARSDRASQLASIQINVLALTALTRILLPGMIARGRGRIMNVASTAAFQPGPLMAVYYATKAYVLSFSEAIGSELKGTGVTVTTLCPGPTTTEFHSSARMGTARLHRLKLMMDAASVARIGYRGMQRGKSLVIPGIGNWLLAQSVRFTPRKVTTHVVHALQVRLVERE